MIVILLLAVVAVPVLLIVLMAMVGGLNSRVTQLEDALAALQATRPTDARASPAATVDAATPASGFVVEPMPRDLSPTISPSSPAQTDIPSAAARAPIAAASSAPPSGAPKPVAAASAQTGPDPLTRLAGRLRRWFTEGNVPVKVGMLVLFAGVAALLKHASDQGWLRLPMELRLAGVALAALAGLVFGWRQRERKRGFALSLQGGAIGVLLLVVFAASRLYAFLPVSAAFALSVVLVAGTGVLAVRQNAMALAVLGILAGFLAPLWLSTGQGSQVALFGYYAVLNAAILAIAWWRPWRVLNLMGFVFTFAIGTFWGVLQYRADKFASTEPFLLLFFVFYLLIPILYARLYRPDDDAGRHPLVDGCLVFGLPLVAFSLQAALLEGARMPLALCALGLALIYAGLAWGLQRRPVFAALVALYAVLAAGFATLAVPLALSAHATAAVFALEGAALIWLGLRQGRRLPRVSGALLQLAAAGAFLAGMDALDTSARPIANPAFMGAALIALAGFASAWSYRGKGGKPSLAFYLWGLAWWLGNGLHEINTMAAMSVKADWMLAFLAITGGMAAEVHRRRPAPALAWTAMAGLAAALPLVFVQQAAHVWPLTGTGLLAWLGYAVAGWWMVRALREESVARASLSQVLWLVAWSLLATLCIRHGIQGWALGDGWRFALPAVPWLLVAAALHWRPEWISPLVADALEKSRGPLQVVFAVVLAVVWLQALEQAGNSAPLPWVALINPLDLLQLAILVVLVAWLSTPLAPSWWRARRLQWLAGAGFVLLSVVTLRAAHHWGGVVWGAAMFSTSLVQMSLTVVWSVLGVLGWILGSQRAHRGLWRVGAVLMAVVLAKLVLIDRQHLGSGFGIASFIAYGLLCTAVGYFAPVPASAPETPSSDDLEQAE